MGQSLITAMRVIRGNLCHGQIHLVVHRLGTGTEGSSLLNASTMLLLAFSSQWFARRPDKSSALDNRLPKAYKAAHEAAIGMANNSLEVSVCI